MGKTFFAYTALIWSSFRKLEVTSSERLSGIDGFSLIYNKGRKYLLTDF